MQDLQCVVDNAVRRGDVPYVVGVVATADGVVWAGAAGDARPGVAADPNTSFRLWSMTKALGSLAVLLLVDRGALSMDSPLGDVLPEIEELQVIETVDSTGAAIRGPETSITLRHLLTHTSGLAYPLFDAKMMAYAAAYDVPHVAKGTIAELTLPLMFDPGRRFAYGSGVDWAGLAVQRVDGRPIDVFCREEVFEPLDLRHTSFYRKDVETSLADVFARREDGQFDSTVFDPPLEPEFYGLGGALYGSATDYIRFLRFILRRGELDGVRLLSPTTFSLMTSDLIGHLEVPILRSGSTTISCDVDLHSAHTVMGHTASGLVTRTDVPGMRSAGTLWWAGILNTHFWAEPTRNVAAVLMTQTLPFCDARYMDVLNEFERAVYEATTCSTVVAAS